MNTTIQRSARFSAFGLYHLTLALLLGMAIGMVATLSILITAGSASADEGNTNTTVVASYGEDFLVVDGHNVVVSSTLRHCPLEDGGPRLKAKGPCTWNLGDQADGNGNGLAYVLYREAGQRRAVYVWPANPAINGWHWMHEGPATSDCVWQAYRHFAHCADGRLRIDHPRTAAPVNRPCVSQSEWVRLRNSESAWRKSRVERFTGTSGEPMSVPVLEGGTNYSWFKATACKPGFEAVFGYDATNTLRAITWGRVL